jgi:S-methylmethionine-dependent homocysteine/selenocysteine methylase
VEEAIGLARAAKAADMPIVISFIVQQGGQLSGGETLEETIEQVDAATDSAPAYYMINCTHPTEFDPALTSDDWTKRLGGLMPNAVAMDTLSLCVGARVTLA